MNHEQAIRASAKGFVAGWSLEDIAERVVRGYLEARAESYDSYDLPKVTLPALLADFKAGA